MLEAETILQDAMQTQRRVFGPEHPDTVWAESVLSKLRADREEPVAEEITRLAV